jgi:hypothetical protein
MIFAIRIELLEGVFEGMVAIAVGHHQIVFQAKLVNRQFQTVPQLKPAELPLPKANRV